MAAEFKISVIIPVYNHGNYLGEAIQSVLDQSLKPLEIIVIDSSEKELRSFVARFSGPINYFNQSKAGIGTARNFGLQKAKGNYFAHLDADDVWLNNKLELQVQEFKKKPHLDICGGYMEAFFSPELSRSEQLVIKCPEKPIPGFSASVLLVRKSAFHQVGWYNSKLKVGQDLDWFVRARELRLVQGMATEVVAKRRIHRSNTGRLNRQFDLERVQVLKAALDRKRESGKNGKITAQGSPDKILKI